MIRNCDGRTEEASKQKGFGLFVDFCFEVMPGEGGEGGGNLPNSKGGDMQRLT